MVTDYVCVYVHTHSRIMQDYRFTPARHCFLCNFQQQITSASATRLCKPARVFRGSGPLGSLQVGVMSAGRQSGQKFVYSHMKMNSTDKPKVSSVQSPSTGAVSSPALRLWLKQTTAQREQRPTRSGGVQQASS